MHELISIYFLPLWRCPKAFLHEVSELVYLEDDFRKDLIEQVAKLGVVFFGFFIVPLQLKNQPQGDHGPRGIGVFLSDLFEKSFGLLPFPYQKSQKNRNQ